ncbi:hypothetical protein Lser_V15G32828 [Lactuca serriola]
MVAPSVKPTCFSSHLWLCRNHRQIVANNGFNLIVLYKYSFLAFDNSLGLTGRDRKQNTTCNDLAIKILQRYNYSLSIENNIKSPIWRDPIR